jgi:hypothetical protein
MKAEHFIENKYHSRAGLEADKLIEDKTGKEVSFEEIAEAYHEHKLKLLGIVGVMQWVVCKEDLPKKEGNYLINWDGVVLEAEFYKEDKIWISEEGMLYKNVTHWAHLPKPPCL